MPHRQPRHVNRYLRRLTAIEDGRPPRGAEIVAGDKVVGEVTSSVARRCPGALGTCATRSTAGRGRAPVGRTACAASTTNA